MPNYCNYSMCVKGKKENIEEFVKVIQAHYDYNTMEFSHDRHLFRVFDAYYDEIEELADNSYQVVINGCCAWSVISCMFEDGYYSDIKERFPNDCRGTTLPIESKRLNLDIEVYSDESGCCFQEHYVVIKGDVVCEESVDWYEYFIDEYDSKEEAEKNLDIEITDAEWQEGYASRGGFETWDFEI